MRYEAKSLNSRGFEPKTELLGYSRGWRPIRIVFANARNVVNLVPAETLELVEIHIPAAQHANDLRAGRRLDQPVQERGHRRRSGTFRHELRVVHRPDDGIEDLLVGQ